MKKLALLGVVVLAVSLVGVISANAASIAGLQYQGGSNIDVTSQQGLTREDIIDFGVKAKAIGDQSLSRLLNEFIKNIEKDGKLFEIFKDRKLAQEISKVTPNPLDYFYAVGYAVGGLEGSTELVRDIMSDVIAGGHSKLTSDMCNGRASIINDQLTHDVTLSVIVSVGKNKFVSVAYDLNGLNEKQLADLQKEISGKSSIGVDELLNLHKELTDLNCNVIAAEYVSPDEIQKLSPENIQKLSKEDIEKLIKDINVNKAMY